MAREYAAKLTLQDNWNVVIDKAIKSLDKLQNEFNKIKVSKISPEITPKMNKSAIATIQRDLKQFDKESINIKAKMDSSVYSTMNKINKAIVPNKTIKITAKDEVTHTITNLERNMFTMESKLKASVMTNPFKSMSTSAENATSKISSLINGATTVGNITRAIGGTTAISALASGIGAGAVAGASLISNESTQNYKKWLESQKGQKIKDDINKDKKIRKPRKGDNYIETSFHDFENPISSYGKYMEPFDSLDVNAGVEKGSKAFQNHKMFLGTDFHDTVLRQQSVMKNNFGDMGSAGKYKQTTAMFQNKAGKTLSTDAMIAPMNEIEIAWKNLSSKISKSSLFENVVSKANSAMKSLKFNKVTKIGFEAAFTAERAKYMMSDFLSKAKKIALVPLKFTAKVLDLATKPIQVIYKGIKGLAGKIHNIKMKIDENPIMKGLNKIGGVIKNVLKGAALGGAAAIGFAAKSAISGASDLEENKLSMAHFIDYADKNKNGGKNTLSKEQIQGKTNGFINNLRDYANVSPFATNDVIEAGTRATTIMGGDTGEAMNLTKIAGDMSALTPGKSIQDAMEALADVKTSGDMERLKEFGLKVSAEQFAGLAGKKNMSEMNEDDMNKAYKAFMDTKLNPMFGGGASEKANTVSGKMSTIKGKMGSMMADVGTMFQPQIKKLLDGVIGVIDNVLPKVMKFFQNIADGKSVLSPVFDFIGKSIIYGKDLFIKSIPIIKQVIKDLTPTFEFVGKIVGKILGFIGDHMGDVGDIVLKLSGAWNKAWPKMQSALEYVWRFIQPILGLLWDAAKIVADIFIFTWPGIKGVIEVLWKGVKPILELFRLAIEGLKKSADEYADAWDKIAGKVPNKSSTGEGGGLTKGKGVPTGFGNAGGGVLDPEEDNTKATKGKPLAVGSAYIPYNGYKATLHRGETVLSRVDADNYRNNKPEKTTSNVTINVNGSDNPDIVAQKVYSKLVEILPNIA